MLDVCTGSSQKCHNNERENLQCNYDIDANYKMKFSETFWISREIIEFD